jgi:predicted RNase H-like HicB family nuclease
VSLSSLKTGPGLHVIVGPAPETTAAHLEAANKNAAESQRLPIDLVLVLSRDGATLDDGYVVGYANAATAHHYYPQKGEPNLAGPVTICKGPDSFAYWFAVLMNHLVGVLAFPPVLFEYVGAPHRIVRVPPPKRLTMVYWRGEQFFLGKLLDHPEIMTQGETLEELEKNLKDAYLTMVLEDVLDNYQTKELAL